MMLVPIIVIIFNLLSFIRFSCAVISLEALVQGSNYDTNLRPYFGGPTVNITNHLIIASLGPINEQDMTFELRFYHRQWWNDPRLAQNATNAQPITSNKHPGKLIWMPDIYVANAQDVKYLDQFTRTIISPNGDMYFSREVHAKCRCLMDLKRYPIDKQNCFIRFESYSFFSQTLYFLGFVLSSYIRTVCDHDAFSSNDLRLDWHSSKINVPGKTKTTALTGYELLEMSKAKKMINYGSGSTDLLYENIYLHFNVKRNSVYYAYKAFIPTVFLSVFNIGSYWIPDKAMPARVTLIITTFLANMLILQSVTEQTIKVSYTTAMQLFLLVNIMFLMTSILQYLILLFIKHRKMKKKEEKPTGLFGNNFANKEYKNGSVKKSNTHQVNKTEMKDEKEKPNGNAMEMSVVASPLDVMQKRFVTNTVEDVHLLDRVFRIMAPSMYFIFLIAFFSYFNSNQ